MIFIENIGNLKIGDKLEALDYIDYVWIGSKFNIKKIFLSKLADLGIRKIVWFKGGH